MEKKPLFRPLIPSERFALPYLGATAIFVLGVALASISLVAPLIAFGVAEFYVYLSRTPRTTQS